MSVAIMISPGRTGIDEPPGMQALSLRPTRTPPAISSSFANGVPDDPRDRGEGLGVVDRRRLAVQTITRRERRLVPRHPLLAFQRFKECRFFAADVRAVAVMVVQMEREAAAQD